MTIPLDLSDADLTFACPYCAHPLVKRGSWFKVVSRYRCEKCQSEVRIGYPDKLKLFDHYKRQNGQRPR
ncbi:MAG: hypothetical protein EOR71_32585 [Mesorhizobium sp.]|nr:MAG: hypothetical protein EOR71_32585 [Mesorhizobium sp.]